MLYLRMKPVWVSTRQKLTKSSNYKIDLEIYHEDLMTQYEEEHWYTAMDDNYNLELHATLDKVTTKLDLTQEIPIKEHMQKIANMTQLTELSLYDCISLNKKLHYFSKLTNLRHLDLSFSKLVDDDLIPLNHFENLEYLCLSNNYVTGASFKYIKLGNLKTCVMQNTDLNDQGVVNIFNTSPDLEKLFIWGGDLTNESIKVIGDSNLQELELHNLEDITDMLPLARLPRLRTLTVYSNIELSFPILPRLKELVVNEMVSNLINPNIHLYQKLESLHMNCPPSNGINKLLNLTELSIRATPSLTDTQLLPISSMIQLRDLDLRMNTELTDNIFKYLKKLTNLKKLNINMTKVSKYCAREYIAQYNSELEIFPNPLIVNLTPHAVNVITASGTVVYPASGNVARLDSIPRQHCELLSARTGVPVYSAQFTKIIGMPEEKTTDIIVSMTVAQYLQCRIGLWKGTVFSQDTGPGQAVRNEDGNIVGVKRLVVW